MTTIWILLAVFPAAGGAADGPAFAGRPLADALAQLQAGGLHIVYSSAVVTPSMTVEQEPRGDDPRTILGQILTPHGLIAEDGPGGTILIVVAPPMSNTLPASGEVRGLVTVDGIPVGFSDGWLLYVTRAGWPRAPKLVPCP